MADGARPQVDDGGGGSLNSPPTLVYIMNAITELPEGTDTSQRIKMGDIRIKDDGRGKNTITLGGVDAVDFEVDGLELYLRAGIRLNYAAQRVHRVGVDVEDFTIEDRPPAVQITHSLRVLR